MRGKSFTLPRMTFFSARRRIATAAGLAGALSVSLLTAASAAQGANTLVNPVPAASTPSINDGTVYAIAQVGGQMVVGGDFTNATSNSTLNQPYALAFDATSGKLDTTGFLPNLNGQVNTVIAGPDKNDVYLGGDFTKVNGHSMRVALLNINTGKIISGWNPPSFDFAVHKLVLADGQLLVGGDFKKVGSKTRDGLVSLDPETGKLTSYVTSDFTGHHNYGTQCKPKKTACAPGRMGVHGLAVNAAGTKLVVTGNFTTVDKAARDQVAMLDLGANSASLDPKWATDAYTSPCFANSFDSYIRDVAFSPDGSYFVITATGGVGTNSDGTDSLCDAAARFNTSDTGTDVRPQWVAYTGEDSLWTDAITSSAVYVGGHQRWMNNRYGNNVAGPGAVPRPDIAALNPTNGLPYSWNPGKNPRGAGVFAILPTADGLWVGSDTDYIGNRTYLRPKIAFFPLAGGQSVPADATSDLPGRVFEVGDTSSAAADPGRLDYREFNGTSSGTQVALNSGIDWSGVRGAFFTDGELFYGKPDGNLYERSFDGTSFGAETLLDPWNDPTWDNVKTGSGQTYQGQASSMQADIPTISSMVFLNGRIYYTMTGVKTMFWRTFEPEDGVVGEIRHTLGDSNDWSNVAGAFVTPAGQLYFADQTTGKLMTIHLDPSGAVGKATVADANTDWASRGLALLSQSDAPTPTPTAAFSAACSAHGLCSFTASPWTDPDGGTVRYGWSFGDTSSQAPSAATTTTHQYPANGTFTATLTVVDTAGATASATRSVTINAPVRHVRFMGSSSAATKSGAAKVRVPRKVKKHDALLLAVSTQGHRKPLLPKGWHKIGSTHHKGLSSAVFDRNATNRNLDSTIKVKFRKGRASTATLVAYRNLSPLIVERLAHVKSTKSHVHPTPKLTHLTTGTTVLSVWTGIANKRLSWRLPHGVTKRDHVVGNKRPFAGTALADKALGGAKFHVGPARTTAKTLSAVQWAIALAPGLT